MKFPRLPTLSVAALLELPLIVRGAIGLLGDADVVVSLSQEGNWMHDALVWFFGTSVSHWTIPAIFGGLLFWLGMKPIVRLPKWRPFERRLEAVVVDDQPSLAPPAATLLNQFVEAQDAGRWLYNNGSEKVRDMLRGDNIGEIGRSAIQSAPKEARVQLYCRRESGLVWEPFDATECDFSTFERMLGANGKPRMDVAILETELPVMLAYYEAR